MGEAVIVVGVDPGGRDTGIAVVDVPAVPAYSTPRLLASTTVRRADDGPLTRIPRDYLLDVNAAILHYLADPIRYGLNTGTAVELIAIEGVEAPGGFANGRKQLLDPAGIIATAQVLGAVLGRAWSVPVVVVRPGHNGRVLPLTRYPEPLATKGKGHDKRRHERSAYDCAVHGPALARLQRIL